ncbi:LOW QUALITY PROTEIN: hypothetical protein CFC21_074939 [Triticum aestivum]|uniref:Cytochrome P450 n=2 Tax=Triticum aestivum TaxID=4565 RepID=A0A9R1HPQ0_WHEAT|nr:LOW QUALITY PROTEIN: hypothetical protein CFC21_074939 [Triticum aestivum]
MPISLLLSLPQQWQQWQPLLLALLVSVVSLLLLLRRKGKGRLRLPPGPAQVPLLGNLHQLGSLPHRALRDLARLHGPVMQLRLGTAPAVVLSSAEAAWEVLKVHDLDCCTRPVSPGPRRLTYGLKNVAFAPYGAYWRHIRKLLVVELLSARRVKAAWYARQEKVDMLMSALLTAGAARRPVALDEHVLRLSDCIIGTVAFGSVYASDKFALNESFQHALDEAMEMISSTSAEDFFPGAIGRVVDRVTGVMARRERIFHQLDPFFETVIAQHLDPERANLPEKENGGDLVDVLIAYSEEHRKFTRDHVKAIIFDMFIAGIDTSSMTILWAMSELIRKPRVISKAQAEIRAVAGGNVNGRVVSEDVSKLSYLGLVVKETLRLHPPALLLPRETMRHIQVAGYDVLAKTRVYVNWAIGRDPASWPDNPEEFNPDRFEGSGIDLKGEHPELMPFGMGRRICPGMSMAMATVEFTLANLLCCFEWALLEWMTGDGVSMEEEGRLVFHRKTPLVLLPTAYVPPRPRPY